MAYIIWDPNNIIIDLGFYALRWYSLLFGLGIVFCYMILKNEFAKENVPEAKLEKLALYIILAIVIGARLGHCLFYDFDYYSENILEIFLPFRFSPSFEFTGYQGLASHGGFFGILIALFLYCRQHNLGLLWTLDKLALVMPLAFCFIRLGNLMNSEIIGEPANVPWAFIFVHVDDIPRHPAQLYEALAYLAIFILLNILRFKLHKRTGFLFGVFAALAATARFLIEFLKEDQSAFEAGMSLNMGQILSIPFFILGIVLIFLKRKNQIPILH